MAFNRVVIKDGNGYIESFSAQVAAATKPLTLVKYDSNGKFAVADAGDDEARLFVLGNRDYIGETLETAYNADDTGVGYEIIPNRTVQLRATVGTYAKGDPLTVAANGLVQKATLANQAVLGHIDRGATITSGGSNIVQVRCSQGKVVTA